MPSVDALSSDRTLKEATERARRYEWEIATSLYEQAIETFPREYPSDAIARATELLANCYYRRAFLSETREEFKHWMSTSHSAYERAAVLRRSSPASKGSKARALFSTYWASDSAAERKRLIDQCISNTEEAAQVFAAKDDRRELAYALENLLHYRSERLNFATDRSTLSSLFEAAVEAGWKAAGEFEILGEDQALLESYQAIVDLFTGADYVLEPTRYQEFSKRVERLLGEIPRIPERIGAEYALCLAGEAKGLLVGDLVGDIPKGLAILEAELPRAKATRDSYLIGRLCSNSSSYTRWIATGEEYVEQRRASLERALALASDAIRNLTVCGHGAWLKQAYGRYVEVSTDLALTVETDPERKRQQLRHAIEKARPGMVYEDHGWVSGVGHELSRAMYFLATMVTDAEEKAKLLADALPVREETVRTYEVLSPHSWSMGVMLNYLALLKAELSKTVNNPAKKTELLRDAVGHTRRCVTQCAKWATSPALIRALAGYEESYGDILVQLARLISKPETNKDAINAYREAIGHLEESGYLAPVGQVRWKLAQVYDSIADYKEASSQFSRAARDYRLLTTRLPTLSATFYDLSCYMDAWALIEESRLHHTEERFTLAAESYTRAAATLEPTKSWRPLARHYVACSLLEQGESLSQQEQQVQAIDVFSKAEAMFADAKLGLEQKLQSASPPEKKELAEWPRVSAELERYCRGRVELEEAGLLDQKGEEEASSRKYRRASEVFQELVAGTDERRARSEFEALMLLCDAWALMKEAESKALPELFAQAAGLFDKVEHVALGRRSRLLALASSSMCKALQAGTEFRRTRDTGLYSEIKRKLETAADYYEQARFKRSSGWARATQRLFDALVYMADAEAEKEQMRKTGLYALAEKHLEVAGRLYEESGFAEKKADADRHLKHVREARKLVLTPYEALADNPPVAVAGPVSLTRDRAVGVEKFEVANVVGILDVEAKEVRPGGEVAFRVEIGNIGKATATLVRLENAVPPGFQPDAGKTVHRVQDGHVDLRGKRLQCLETHEIRLVLKAPRKGMFQLSPQVVYVDERGNLGTRALEAVTLTVRELGLTGWIKGR